MGCADYFIARLQQIKQWASSFFHWLFCCTRKPTQEAEPERLTQDFLRKRTKIMEKDPHSGYQVYIKPDENQKLQITIKPMGSKNQPIDTPPLKKDETECTCCDYSFEHTRNTEPNPLCDDLTKHIAQFNMFAIFSRSTNLLLIPDTTKDGINAVAYPHLFALNENQLHNVFSATLTANAYLQSRYPDYKPHIAAHVGVDGAQTEGLLHVRFEQLPQDIKIHSLDYIQSLVLTGTSLSTFPTRYEFEMTCKDGTTRVGSHLRKLDIITNTSPIKFNGQKRKTKSKK
jgi:hypothetical protein